MIMKLKNNDDNLYEELKQKRTILEYNQNEKKLVIKIMLISNWIVQNIVQLTKHRKKKSKQIILRNQI